MTMATTPPTITTTDVTEGGPSGKHIGSTTKGATTGTALAGAVAIILVWLLGEFGVDVPAEVQGALVVILAAVGTLVGGKLTPTDQKRTETVTEVRTVVAPGPSLIPTAGSTVIPDGDGEHRAEVAP